MVNFQLQYTTAAPPGPPAPPAGATAAATAAPGGGAVAEWRAVPGITADASIDLAAYVSRGSSTSGGGGGYDDGAVVREVELMWPTAGGQSFVLQVGSRD